MVDSSRKGIFQETFSVVLVLEIGKIYIEPQDILQCYFVEDIFSYSMSGKLVFNDLFGIIEHGPFTGNEQIIIDYGVNEDRQLAFDIWRIGNITQSANSDTSTHSVVELYFVDLTFQRLKLRRYSRSWPTKTPTTDVARDVLSNLMGLSSVNMDIEESDTKLTEPFSIPYWTPLQTLNWLLRRSTSGGSGTSGYLCYNNTDGGFKVNIHTLNRLFGKKTFKEEDVYRFDHTNDTQRNKILEWWIDGIDKISTKVLKGGVWKGYDFSKKKFLTKKYTYGEGISNSVILGRKSLFTDISDETTSNILLGEKDSKIIENIVYNDWVKRYSVQQVLNVVVRGFEDRYAGMQIEIDWPSTSKDEVVNQQMKGLYLVKSITHMLADQNANFAYRQRMVLLKNGYQSSDYKGLVTATQTNIGDTVR
jgi:hypothetical protein